MNGYKRIVRNRHARQAILRALDFVPDKQMIQLQYRIKTGRWPNLARPQRMTEKLQWYKLNYRDPLMTRCVDKYEVRGFLEERGFSDLLIPLLGVYDAPEDIDATTLPEHFIIKTTNSSGTNLICHDKQSFDWDEAHKTLNHYMKRRGKSAGREWAYEGVRPRIVVEQLIEDPDDPYGELSDYKFICFDGKCSCLWVDVARHSDHRRNFYTTGWKRMQVESDHPNFDMEIPAPSNLDEMIAVAEALSCEFPHVRVDLYSVGNRIYFGELTFYLLSGYVQFVPDDFDFELGSQFRLPEVRIV